MPDNGVGNGGNGNSGGGSALGDLAGIGALITPFVAALGALALTGTIGRVQRNEPETIALALLLVLAGGGLWLFANHSKKGVTALRFVAWAAAVAGFGLGLWAAVNTANDEPRPRIEASLTEAGKTLKADVKASNMETEDRLAIYVDVFTVDRSATKSVYQAFEGPDADGNVNATVALTLPKGPYTYVSVQAFTEEESKCDKTLRKGGEPNSGTGCVVMAIVPGPEDASKPKAADRLR